MDKIDIEPNLGMDVSSSMDSHAKSFFETAGLFAKDRDMEGITHLAYNKRLEHLPRSFYCDVLFDKLF